MSVGPAALPRLLAGLEPDGVTMTLADHERIHGPIPRLSPEELIGAVARSGLRGRGGADFPTARKLQSVAERRRGAVLIVNGIRDRARQRKGPPTALEVASPGARRRGAGGWRDRGPRGDRQGQ